MRLTGMQAIQHLESSSEGLQRKTSSNTIFLILMKRLSNLLHIKGPVSP